MNIEYINKCKANKLKPKLKNVLNSQRISMQSLFILFVTDSL